MRIDHMHGVCPKSFPILRALLGDTRRIGHLGTIRLVLGLHAEQVDAAAKVQIEVFTICFFLLNLLTLRGPVIFFSHPSTLSSFWTSRGHRCRSFFPPVLAFVFFFAHRVRQSNCSSIFHRVVLLTRALALFRKSIRAREQVPRRICTSVISGGLELHETDQYQARR